MELNKKRGYALGIDIGESYIKGAVSDFGMEILANESINAMSGREKDLESGIKTLMQKLFAASKIDKKQVEKIGITINQKGGPGDIAENLIAKTKDALKEEVIAPVLCGSKALCAAFGERVLNPDAKEAPSILYFYKDRGEGVFIKDEEFYEADEEKKTFRYLKAWAREHTMAGEAKKIAERGVGTKIVEIAGGNPENIIVETVIKAAGKQDEVALDLVRMAGLNLGVRAAYLVNMCRPKIVLIGGGIEEAEELFLTPLRSSVNRFISQEIKGTVKLIPGALGKDACVKGNVFLAVREVFMEA